MKNLFYKLHRPLVWAIGAYCIGVIGGTMWTRGSYRSFFVVILLVVLGLGILYTFTKTDKMGILVGLVLIGLIRVLSHPVLVEEEKLQGVLTLQGTIESLDEGRFNSRMVIKDVSYEQEGKQIGLKSKVQVLYDQVYPIVCGNQVELIGKVKPSTKPYNPSDMDYGMYLKGQGIVAQIELIQLKEVIPRTTIIHQVRTSLKAQIEEIFNHKDKGLVEALLLGNQKNIEEDVKTLYQTLGIAHVLALSGLHLTVISMVIWKLLGRLGLEYSKRNQFSVIGIWLYCIITGMGLSTVRASIMLTAMLLVRSIWEEDDLLSSLALAAFIILGMNPFALFQIGFQLSFGAIVGVAYQEVIYSYIKHVLKWSKKRLRACRVVLPSIVLTLILSPILAYHFYEVPVLGVFLNILVIPLFSLMIPILFLIIGISFIVPAISQIMGMGIVALLGCIECMGSYLTQLPYATYISGQPTSWCLVLYYSSLGFLWVGVYLGKQLVIKKRQLGNYKPEKYFVIASVFSLVLIWGIAQIPSQLELMHLYVGQGDCCVITTPKGQTILIDAGTEKSATTLQRYLKYKGAKRIDLAILSHPHEDHIGGLLELIKEGVSIGQVAWADTKTEDEYRTKLINLCEKNAIPLINLYKGGKIQVEGLQFDILWPDQGRLTSDPNENSLVCLLTYNNVTELFTGDIGIQTEMQLLKELPDVDLLKVAHHGSKNSTSLKFIEKLNPEYGMISSGIKNRYGHPHIFTLERLEEQEIKICTTSDQGAIKVVTDGLTYTVENNLQEDK